MLNILVDLSTMYSIYHANTTSENGSIESHWEHIKWSIETWPWVPPTGRLPGGGG